MVGATRQEMHDFVLGKPIAPINEGNVVELIDDSTPNTQSSEEQKNTTCSNDNKHESGSTNGTCNANDKNGNRKGQNWNNNNNNNTMNNNNNFSTKENRHNHQAPKQIVRPKSLSLQAPESRLPAAFQQQKHNVQQTNNNNNNNNGHNDNKSKNRVVVSNPYLAGRQRQQNQQQPQQKDRQPLNASNNNGVHYNSEVHREQQTHVQQQQRQQQNQDQDQNQSHYEQQQQQQLGQRPVIADLQETKTANSSNVANDTNPPKNYSFFEKSSAKKSNNRRKSLPIHRFVFQPGPVPVDTEAAQTYVYPQHDDYPTRQYQLEMTEKALNYNTLVSLPTGLGKTHIAAVVMYNFYRWFAKGGGKIIFLAPTLPLVNQQVEACFKIVGMPVQDTAVMTGKINAEDRKDLWKTKRLFYCTPQTVQRDLITACCGAAVADSNEVNGNNITNNINDDEIDPETSRAFSKVVCLVLDEAHKASGDYAYTRVVELLENAAHAKFRIVGLSATPGTTIKAIQSVVEALRAVKIEARTESDPTVKRYLHTKRSELVIVERNNHQRDIERMISNILNPYLEYLRTDQLLQTYGNATLTSYSIIKAIEVYRKNNAGNINGVVLTTFYAVRQLIEIRTACHQSLQDVKTKLRRLKQGPNRGIICTIVKSKEFDELLRKVIEVTGGGIGAGSKGIIDPKLTKLCELLKLHFERANACNSSSRAIVFAQFRDSVKEIVDCLERMKPLIRSRYFVGQNKGSSNTKKMKGKKTNAKNQSSDDNINNDAVAGASSPFIDERVSGMKQAEQHQALKDFRDDVFNVLVCTSIGEEGLDIGEVDLIINYDVIRSPIRTIQRAGRTGRKRDGRVISLISEGQEEETHKKRITAERTLVSALGNPKKFVMASHHPMLPNQPTIEYKKITMPTKLHMSQVAGAQKTSKVSKRGRPSVAAATEDKNAWRLDTAEESERQRTFGKGVVGLDATVTWDKLRKFFCKNRVDPYRLPRDIQKQLKYHQREECLRRRQEIRQECRLRQNNQQEGRNHLMLNHMKKFGSVHSSAGRSGYRNILKVFPLDPVAEDGIESCQDKFSGGIKRSDHKNILKMFQVDSFKEDSNAEFSRSGENPSSIGVTKNIFGNQISTSTHTTQHQPIDLIANDSTCGSSYDTGTITTKKNFTATLRAEEVTATASNTITANNTAHANASESNSSIEIGAVSRNDRFNTHSNVTVRKKINSNGIDSNPLPSSSLVAEKCAPRLPFELPDEIEKVIFRLPTPPPSSDEEDENDEGDSINDQIVQAESSQRAPAGNIEENTLSNPEPIQTLQYLTSEPVHDNEQIVFRLPTPPPSSSEDEDESDEDNDDDNGVNKELLQPQSKISRKLDTTNESIVRINQSTPDRVDNFKVTRVDITTDCKNQVRRSLGYDDDNDPALCLLKHKVSTRKKGGGSQKLGNCLMKSNNEEKSRTTKNDVQLSAVSAIKSQEKSVPGFSDEKDPPLDSLKCKSRTKKKRKDLRKLSDDVKESGDRRQSKKTEEALLGSYGSENSQDSPLISLKSIPSIKKNKNSSRRILHNADEDEENNENKTKLKLNANTGASLSSNSVKMESELLAASNEASPVRKIRACNSINESRELNKGENLKVENKEKDNDETESDDDAPIISLKEKKNLPQNSHELTEEVSEVAIEENVDIRVQPKIDEITKTSNQLCAKEHDNENKSELSNILGRRNRLRILETPECKNIHSNLDSTTQNDSQKSIVDHLNGGKRRKRLLSDGITDSDEEVDTAVVPHIINIDVPKPSYQNMTPSTSIHQSSSALANTPATGIIKSQANVLELLQDTPENDKDTAGNNQSGKNEKKRSIDNFLTDTPGTHVSVDDVFCQICTSLDSTDADPIVLCDGCNLGFHKQCYQIKSDISSDSGPWFCDLCNNCTSTTVVDITCTYCNQKSGTLRKQGNAWNHPMCSVFSSNITDSACSACSLYGAVKCDKCQKCIHPYCAVEAGWTIVCAHHDNKSSQLLCPDHDDLRGYELLGVRIIRKRKNEDKNTDNSPRPKKLVRKSSKATGTVIDLSKKQAATTLKNDREKILDDKAAKKERRRQGMSRFALEEAEIASDQEGGNEEDELRRIEAQEEECSSQNSFINDNSFLTQHFSQDDLGRIDPDANNSFDYGNAITTSSSHASVGNHQENHTHRAFDAQLDRENRFKTPNFNRRMKRRQQHQPGSSGSPESSNTSSSQRGLGNMNFIRSVLEHHRQGGDCDQIESYYHRATASEGIEDNREGGIENAASSPFLTAAAAMGVSRSLNDNNRNEPVVNISRPKANAVQSESSTYCSNDKKGNKHSSNSRINNNNVHEPRVLPKMDNSWDNFRDPREAKLSINNNGVAFSKVTTKAKNTAYSTTVSTVTTDSARIPTPSNTNNTHSNKSKSLTAEQLARIKSNREAALRRRKEFQTKNNSI